MSQGRSYTSTWDPLYPHGESLGLFAAWVFLTLLLAGMASPPNAVSGDEPAGYVYDADIGREIMGLCAGCHGEFGQGGGGGEYPRLAGLPARYIAKQLRAFKSGEWENMAMAPYANERELPEADILNISTYLAGLELYTRMPQVDPDLDSYAKLLIAKRVLNIQRYEGDPAAGEAVYSRECRKCHGREGSGQASTPQLAGQYSDYLAQQVTAYRTGKRESLKMKKPLQGLSDADLADILAYLSVVDD